MGVEGHPWDSALFTGAAAHVESYQRDVAVLDSVNTSFQRPKLPVPQGWLALCTFLASTSVFVWLQLASIALRPFQPNWSQVTLGATKGRKAPGIILSPTLVILVSTAAG